LLINTGRIEVAVPCAGYFAALCRRQAPRRIAADFLLNLIAYNLIRIPKLVAA
jgi:hypothetical protein